MQNDNREHKKLLTIGEASEYLGVSVDTLRRWERKGRITPYRSPGGHRHYETSELDKLFDKRYTRDEPTIRSKSEDIKKSESVEVKQETPTTNLPKITLPAWRAIREEAPDVADTTTKEFEKPDVLERPVREIKIPETTKIRITPPDNYVSPSDAYIRQQNTSVLTPPIQSPVAEKEPVVSSSINSNSQTLNLLNNKALLIYMSVMVSLVLFGIAWYFLWKNSQTVLSPIP